MTYYDDNEQIAYPLVGTDDAGIPHSILVDLQVYAPDALGTALAVLSCSVTDLVVSCVLGFAGVPVGVVTVPRTTLVVHEPYEITPVVDGVSGYVVFGQGVTTERLRVDGVYPVLPVALVSYPGGPDGGTMVVGGHRMDGIVDLAVGPGLSIEAATLDLLMPGVGGPVVEVDAILISAVTNKTLEEPVYRCQERADGVLGELPVRSINGVVPSTTGAITLSVVSVQPTTSEAPVTAAMSPRGLTFRDSVPMCQGGAS